MDFRLTADERAVIEAGAQVAGAADPWAALRDGGWLDLVLDDQTDGFRYLGLVAEQLGAGGAALPLVGAGAVWPTLFGGSAGGRRVGVLDGGGHLAEDGAGADVVVVLDAGGRAEVHEAFTAEPVGGLDGDGLARVVLTGEPVAASDRSELVAAARHRAAALAAAEMAGALGRVAAMAAGHVRERQQFGRPISAFQVVAHGAAHLAVLAEAATWAARAACAAPEADNVHSAKGWISRASQEASALAHQLHGAIGFTDEYGLQRLTKRLRTLRFAWGDDAHHYRALGAAVRSEP